MKSLFSPAILTTGLLVSAMASADSSADLVELKLAQHLDEDRGYCVDIAGGRGKDAATDGGLQAHTCYDYSGELLEDQAFSANLIKQGQFKIAYFDVCVSAAAANVGAELVLTPCDQSAAQAFTLKTDGHWVLQSDPSLCITVSSTEKKEGRGGQPVHVMRPISLQSCDAENAAYQTWTTYHL